MNTVGQQEFFTQRRVIAFFQSVLGYDGLGDWRERSGNSNVEDQYLTDWLQGQGHSDQIIERTLFEVHRTADFGGSTTLYSANLKVYEQLPIRRKGPSWRGRATPDRLAH